MLTTSSPSCWTNCANGRDCIGWSACRCTLKCRATLHRYRPPGVKMPRRLWRVTEAWIVQKHRHNRCGFWHRLGGHLSKPIMADTTTTPKPSLTPPSAADPLITQPTHYTSLTPRQLKSAQAAGLLPEPIKLGRKLRAWRKSALDALLSGQATPTTAAAQ